MTEKPDEYEVEHRHIRSVTPAMPGTRAVYCYEGVVDVLPVLTWATYRTRVVWYARGKPGERSKKLDERWSEYEHGLSVGGMVQCDTGIELCDSDRHFVGYLAPDEELDRDWWERTGSTFQLNKTA